jgi:hypothetical protein
VPAVAARLQEYAMSANPFHNLVALVRQALGLGVPFALRGGLPPGWLDELTRLRAACLHAALLPGVPPLEVARRVDGLTGLCHQAITLAAPVWRDRFDQAARAALDDALDRVVNALRPVEQLGHLAAGAAAPPADMPEANDAGSVRAIEAVLRLEENQAVLAIAGSAKTAEEKLRELCAFDKRFLAWDSPQWADLLGVTARAVRDTRFWKEVLSPRR